MSLLSARGVRPRFLLLTTLMVPSLAGAQSTERIRGVVTTRAGAVHQGVLRFEGGAGAWVDPLTGRSDADAEWEDRVLESMGAEVDARGRSVEFLGVRITWDDDRGPSGAPRTSVAVGDLAALRASDDGGMEAELRGGEVVAFHDAFGWVEVERDAAAPTRIEESAIESVRFEAAPRGAAGAPRLEGVVEDRWGRSWSGPLVWTRGQSLQRDSLRGRVDAGNRSVSFEALRTVRPLFGGGARVTTVEGREWEMEGTADVDRSTRGIRVVDPVAGVATLPWVDVRRVTFAPAGSPSDEGAWGYGRFDDRGALRGTVITRDGRTLTGRIHWGDGRTSRWGYLSGHSRSVQLEVPLRSIERLERHGSRGARIHLEDGRVLEVRAGDFDPARGPLVVEDADGSLRVVEWRAVDELAFERSAGSGGDAR